MSGVFLRVARGARAEDDDGGTEGRARTLSRGGDDRLRLLFGDEQLLDAVARVHRARRRAFRRSEGERSGRSMRLAVRGEEVGGARGGGRRDGKQGKFDGPAEGRVLSVELFPGELTWHAKTGRPVPACARACALSGSRVWTRLPLDDRGEKIQNSSQAVSDARVDSLFFCAS